MGLPFAIVRPIAALFTAMFGGWMVNRFAREDELISLPLPKAESMTIVTAVAMTIVKTNITITRVMRLAPAAPLRSLASGIS